MISLRTLAISAIMATFCTSGYAQTAVEHDPVHSDATQAETPPMAMDGSDAGMARLDKQIKTIRAMHNRMMRAGTPEERGSLMAEHMKVMQSMMQMMMDRMPLAESNS